MTCYHGDGEVRFSSVQKEIVFNRLLSVLFLQVTTRAVDGWFMFPGTRQASGAGAATRWRLSTAMTARWVVNDYEL